MNSSGRKSAFQSQYSKEFSLKLEWPRKLISVKTGGKQTTAISTTDCRDNPHNITVTVNDAVMITILFVCFVALRPKSTAMVMAGRSVHLTALFHGQA